MAEMGDITGIMGENRLETTTRVTESTIRVNWTALIKKWEWGIDLKDTTIKDIQEYLTTKVYEYRLDGTSDVNLWDLFQEDFKNFTVDTFKNDHQQFYRLQQDHNSHREPSPSPSPSTRPVYMKQVSDIVKMYTEDQKYDRVTSSFEYKLMIFKSYYEQEEQDAEKAYFKARNMGKFSSSVRGSEQRFNKQFKQYVADCEGSDSEEDELSPTFETLFAHNNVETSLEELD
ncbi:hypothetical protein B7463_g12094, partial [Scytalidium lignicola]